MLYILHKNNKQGFTKLEHTLFLPTYHMESNMELIIISSAVQITSAFYSHTILHTGFPFML